MTSLILQDGISCVLIPSGSFQMGSEHSPEETARLFGGGADWYPLEHPRHEVVLSNDFYMSSTQVTRSQFSKFVAATGYVTLAEKDGFAESWNGSKIGKVEGRHWKNPGHEQTDAHPAVCIAYDDAIAYCKWLSDQTQSTVRLPTEAEWEYAFRLGAEGAFIWGNDPNAGAGYANCADLTARKQNSTWLTFDWDDGFLFTSPSGHFKPSKIGLYDMPGNAWEWCSDWFAPYTDEKLTDPKGAAQGEKRVIRGGAWFGAPTTARAAFRNSIKPSYHGSNIGFRIVVETKQR